MKASLLGSVALVVAASSAQANAQATSPAVPAADSVDGISDIIVTAQRRSESAQRAAVAITAVSGDELVRAGVSKPNDLTSVVPALQVAESSGPYPLFYLRGVGNVVGNPLTDAAVAFNFNGVFIGRPSSTTGFFQDVERIEVLKGPQGTLYGRNATGGVINVIPAAPKLNEFGGSLGAEYGNYSHLRLSGTLNIPFGDKVALRASSIYIKHDGYMNDGSDDQDDFGGRLSLRAEPTDNLTISLVADYFQQRNIGPGSTLAGLVDKDARIGLRSPEGRAAFSSQPNVVLGRTFAPIITNPYQHNDFWGISSNIEWVNEVGTLTIIPAYRKSQLRFASFVPGFKITQREADEQTSLEARFATDESKPIRVLIGGFHYHETNDVPLAQYNAQSQLAHQAYSQGTTSDAAFGRLTFAPAPEIRFTAGARYTHERKVFSGTTDSVLRVCVLPTQFFPTYQPGCPNAPIVAFDVLSPPPPDFDPSQDGTITIPSLIDNTGPNSKRRTFNQFTYRLGADWDVAPNNLLYASYETGFKAGGFFFSADRGTFEPEKISAITLGSKNRFFNNRLQVNLEIFEWTYRNQQISHLGLDSKGTIIFPTENVGRAKIRGFEFESKFKVAPNTLLSFDAQYLDSKYQEFVYTTPNSNGGHGNGTACPSLSVTPTAYVVDCSGRRPPNAPRWTANIGLEQRFDLRSGGNIVVEARGHYQSQILTGLEFVPVQYQDSYWMADASLTYSAPENRFYISAFINNIFNETVATNTTPMTFSEFFVTNLRPPRVYGVRAGIRF